MKNISRPQQATIITLATIIIFGGGGVFFSRIFFLTKKTRAQTTPIPVTANSPSSQAPDLNLVTTHPLTGLPWPPAPNQGWPESPTSTRPFAVVIDNAPEARPQWGISSADIVYDTLVEGGITRLVALFSSKKASKIGPVRSARPYFIRQAQDPHAIFVHSGGSTHALDALALGIPRVTDLNEFSHGAYFWRTNASAPHNLYTSTDQLVEAAHTRGYSLKFTATPRWHFSTSTMPDLPTTTKASIPHRLPTSEVSYTYNHGTASYDRFAGGRAHKDAGNNAPISPKNVIFEFHAKKEIDDPHHLGLVDFWYEGNGAFIALTAGIRIEGTWTRAPDGPTLYTTASGEVLTLSPGQTFIEVVPASLRSHVLQSFQ